MLNKFTKGIIAKIHTELGNNGNNYKYYEDDVAQNFQTPCFYPHILEPHLTKRAGGGYLYEVSYAVHYFPENPRNNHDKNAMGDFLLRALETISIEVEKLGATGSYIGKQIVRGNDMHYNVQEDRVVCEVTYNLLTQIKPNSVEEMNTISIAENVN